MLMLLDGEMAVVMRQESPNDSSSMDKLPTVVIRQDHLLSVENIEISA